MRRGNRPLLKDNMLTIPQISIKLQVHPNTVRRWIKKDGLYSRQVGKIKQYYVFDMDLRDFIKRHYPPHILQYQE